MLILLYSELVDLELVRKQSINFLAGTLYGLLRRLMLIWYLIWWYDGTFARWRYETLAIKIDWSNRRTLQSCLRVKNNYFWGHVMYEFDKLYWEFHKLYRMTKSVPPFATAKNIFDTILLWPDFYESIEMCMAYY